MIGAIFMKFGRAPTTQRIFADMDLPELTDAKPPASGAGTFRWQAKAEAQSRSVDGAARQHVP